MAAKKVAKNAARRAPRRARKTPARAADAEPDKTVDKLVPEPDHVIVRMYRQGLGDCFLLAFATDKPDQPFYALVDCGVHARETDGPRRLLQVMQHVRGATGSQLDLVIATHEHADHLSGFVQKGSPFFDDGFHI